MCLEYLSRLQTRVNELQEENNYLMNVVTKFNELLVDLQKDCLEYLDPSNGHDETWLPERALHHFLPEHRAILEDLIRKGIPSTQKRKGGITWRKRLSG